MREKSTQEFYKFTMRIPLEDMQYLKAAAYRESTPEKMESVTGYLVKLIEADRAKYEGK